MRQIGNYLVEDIPIGSGGMGHVFKGTTSTGRPVAIKQILPNFVADIEFRSRIEREIEFLKRLNNEHVVSIYDHFEGDGNLYIVMEFVEGLNVEQHVGKNGPIQWRDALRYMTQLLYTMQDVHANGIIHRDIKPGNIMIRPDGRICLLDFGVAKDTSSNAAASGHTVFGTVIGTDGYMSPEQAQGLSIDHRSDIYGLGCVLYFMLTGSHAFGSLNSELKMQIAITSGKFPRLAEKVKGLPKDLQTVLDNAVHKDMRKRYMSCREFATDLENISRGKTLIDTANRGLKPLVLTVGRENCDIIIGADHPRVSRRHGEITLKRFTGGEYYVYTDRSSNGTVIDGTLLQNGMTYNIPKGDNPMILLAGEPTCRLDIGLAAAELDRRLREALETDDNADATQHKGESETGENPSPQPPPPSPTPTPKPTPKPAPGRKRSMSMFEAVAVCFRKYANFKGRASRAEFWWFSLFNFIVNAIIYLIALSAVGFDFEYLIMDDVVMNVIGLISLVFFLPSLAVMERRLHDTGRSEWNILYLFIPLAGVIILLVFLASKGTPGPNKYGPAPEA